MHPADRVVAASDPALPGLATLLDAGRVADLLGLPAGSVRPRYLRWKPGTSAVLLVEVDAGHGRVGGDVVVTAVAAGARAKLAKTLAKAPSGTVVAGEPGAGLLATLPAADRDLPALRHLLHGAGRPAPGALQRLAFKPSRRWVGHLERPWADPVVVRAYRRGQVRARRERYLALQGAGVRVPAVRSTDGRRGLLVVEHLPGTSLDALPGGPDGALVRTAAAEAGALAARLHGSRDVRLAVRTLQHDVDDVLAGSRLLVRVLPEQRERVRALTRRVAQGLLPCTAPVPLHGDLGLDQVVRDEQGGLGLIDLDRACLGDPAADVGSVVAGELVGDRTAAVEALLDGYASQRPLPPGWQDHVAAHLLRSAPEPFRLRRDDWVEQTERVLGTLERVLARGAEHAAGVAS